MKTKFNPEGNWFGGMNYFHRRRFLTPEEERVAAEAAAKAKTGAPAPLTLEAITGILKPVLELKDQLPGMVKRHVAEAIEATTQKQQEAAAVKAAEEATRKAQEGESEGAKALRELADLRKANESLAGEIKANKTSYLNAQKQTEILKVVGDRKLLPSVRSMLIGDIANQVQVDDKGAMTMVIEERLETTGGTVKKTVSLQEGVDAYFKARPDVVIASVTGGSGAAGGAGGGTVDPNIDYEELMKYPAKVALFIQEHGSAALAKLRGASEAKRRADRAGRR